MIGNLKSTEYVFSNQYIIYLRVTSTMTTTVCFLYKLFYGMYFTNHVCTYCMNAILSIQFSYKFVFFSRDVSIYTFAFLNTQVKINETHQGKVKEWKLQSKFKHRKLSWLSNCFIESFELCTLTYLCIFNSPIYSTKKSAIGATKK